MKIAMLTGGGDCPGLNAVIRAVVRRGEQYGFEVIGIVEGWRGLLDPVQQVPLTRATTSGILQLGGTILRTSRTNPFKKPVGGEQQVMKNLRELGVDALVAIGGEDTLGVATRLFDLGVKVVGVPKTIDNDLGGTDVTFGFDTAVGIATECIDRLHSTAESHNRVMVCEVMGRHAGWIATHAGIAGGADVILIPERPIDIENVCAHLKHRHDTQHKKFSIVCVAEGAQLGGSDSTVGGEKDAFGHVRLGGIGQRLSELIEQRTGYETRVTVLGHIQRGGTPSAFDRVLGSRFGVQAADMVQRGEWGRMAALRGNAMVSVPLREATAALKTVDAGFFSVAEVFFG